MGAGGHCVEGVVIRSLLVTMTALTRISLCLSSPRRLTGFYCLRSVSASVQLLLLLLLLLKAVLWCCGAGVVRRPAEVVLVRWLLQSAGHCQCWAGVWCWRAEMRRPAPRTTTALSPPPRPRPHHGAGRYFLNTTLTTAAATGLTAAASPRGQDHLCLHMGQYGLCTVQFLSEIKQTLLRQNTSFALASLNPG